MKEPKYVLKIAGSEFVVPDSSGIATLIRAMEDAVPVDADLRKKTITLSYTDEDEEHYHAMLAYLRRVTIEKIPAGVVWKRKNKRGEVENVHVVKKAPKALPPPKRKELPARKPWTALPPRTPQLTLL